MREIMTIPGSEALQLIGFIPFEQGGSVVFGLLVLEVFLGVEAVEIDLALNGAKEDSGPIVAVEHLAVFVAINSESFTLPEKIEEEFSRGCLALLTDEAYAADLRELIAAGRAMDILCPYYPVPLHVVI